MDIELRTVPAAATYSLRQSVLRPHQSIEEMSWEGDDEPDTATFAAVQHDSGTVVAIATVFPSPAPFETASDSAEPPDDLKHKSWRLRGMATREDFRGQGIGSRVLGAALEHVASAGGELVWCNARLKAVPFYQRAGFETWGEEWELPSIGPHVVMWREIGGNRHHD